MSERGDTYSTRVNRWMLWPRYKHTYATSQRFRRFLAAICVGRRVAYIRLGCAVALLPYHPHTAIIHSVSFIVRTYCDIKHLCCVCVRSISIHVMYVVRGYRIYAATTRTCEVAWPDGPRWCWCTARTVHNSRKTRLCSFMCVWHHMGSHAHIRNTHRACCTSSIRSHTNINHSTTHTHTLTDITHIVLQEAFACSTAPRRKTNLNICWCYAVYIERTHHALIVSCDMAIIRHITRSDGFVIVLAVGTTKPRSHGSSWDVVYLLESVCAFCLRVVRLSLRYGLFSMFYVVCGAVYETATTSIACI